MSHTNVITASLPLHYRYITATKNHARNWIETLRCSPAASSPPWLLLQSSFLSLHYIINQLIKSHWVKRLKWGEGVGRVYLVGSTGMIPGVCWVGVPNLPKCRVPVLTSYRTLPKCPVPVSRPYRSYFLSTKCIHTQHRRTSGVNSNRRHAGTANTSVNSSAASAMSEESSKREHGRSAAANSTSNNNRTQQQGSSSSSSSSFES